MIASQAMISAAFSLIVQSIQLDIFPRVRVVHTSTSLHGAGLRAADQRRA
jgi:KUP system potassium uptake protein